MNSTNQLTVMILAGGISHEREISLRSGRRISDALIAAGYSVVEREPDSELVPYLTDQRPDVVWPALHGSSGEDGALLDIISALEIPYVGSSPSAAALAWSKPHAKAVVERSGVNIASGMTLPRDIFRELGSSSVLPVVIDRLGLPLVVKPSQGGSGQGVTVVHSAEELPQAMIEAFTYSDCALIESFVSGLEASVTIFNDGDALRAFSPIEIVPRNGIYSFEARYNAGETTFFTPARVSSHVLDTLTSTALHCHTSLGLGLLSRIDFIVNEDASPTFLEASVMPGFTETSLLPLAAEEDGISLPEFCSSLVLAAFASNKFRKKA